MSNYPKITFTITTSRRFDLFKKTIESFKSSCLDTDLICRYICVDDRSGDADCQRMKEIMPELEIHRSSVYGQCWSIKKLYELIDTEYHIHCEDDWEFPNSGHFIRKAFDVMNTRPSIRQVTFRGWSGVICQENGIDYRMHVHEKMLSLSGHDRWELCKKIDQLWFGYTYNPSLNHVPTIKEIGFEPNQSSHDSRAWDKDFAKKYLAAGYRRANLMEEYCRHIGDGKSLYQRNDVL